MKKSLMVAGLALAAAVSSLTYAPMNAWARAEGTWLWNTFILTSSQTMSIAGTETHSGTESHSGSVTLTGNEYTIVKATQTLGAGDTITADACGGIKRINAAADVTTDTTNTITAPSSSNAGCGMLIVNVSATQTIYLDNNSLFPLTNVASAALGPNGSIYVVSDGSYWLHQRWTEY